MPIPLTEHGRFIIEQLQRHSFMVFWICADNRAFDKRLGESHESRKAEAIKSLAEACTFPLPPGKRPEDVFKYSGKNGAEENQEYSGALEKFVCGSAVCHAIDLYHWYLRRVLQLALNRDRSLIQNWKTALNLNDKRAKEIENEDPSGQILSRVFRGREKNFRDLVHEHLRVPDLGTIPFLVEVRNSIVHHLGKDNEGKIAAMLAESSNPDSPYAGCSRLGVKVVGEQIEISSDAAYESINQVWSDISIMDQSLGRLLNLPTSTQPQKLLRRAIT